MHTFKLDISCHNQWCIQAHDLTLEECHALRYLIIENRTNTEAYKAKQGAAPFLQGYNEPFHGNDGWVLVEFWTQDYDACERYVAFINQKMPEEIALAKKYSSA